MQKHYKIIMKLFKLKKIRMIVVIHYNIGLIYGNTGKYTQALEFYHQAFFKPKSSTSSIILQ
jgi:tetratricopeptide (TPR) repeat protein